MAFSFREVVELLSAWLLLSAAFTFLYSDLSLGSLVFVYPLVFFSVGLGFVLHELGHKLVAQRYGLPAVFRINLGGLGAAIVMSFAGFVLVAPGAVEIRGRLTRSQNGWISLTGPLMNLLLAIAFLGIYLNPFTQTRILTVLSLLGFKINTWIGLFNLIPAQGFDGQHIKEWNKKTYILLAILMAGLYILSITQIQ